MIEKLYTCCFSIMITLLILLCDIFCVIFSHLIILRYEDNYMYVIVLLELS